MNIKPFLAALLSFFFLVPTIAHAEPIVDFSFPVQGESTFTDDYEDQRTGHIHHAIDILAEKGLPVVAVLDGVITFAPMTEPSYGYMLTLEADDGHSFSYVHLNNDTPGTDDGMGGPEHAYAPGVERGARVQRGQVIAWVGDSGNAEDVGSHLHFEMYDENGIVQNPYASLLDAQNAINFDLSAEQSASSTINADKNLIEVSDASCVSDTLIRTLDVSTVYYCGADGGRYVFQNESTFFSWYEDFSTVTYVTTEEMAAIPLKGVVTYRPGRSLVKLQSVSKVYAVAHNGTLRWIPSPELANTLYGADWAKDVRDIPDGFFSAYKVGPDIQWE